MRIEDNQFYDLMFTKRVKRYPTSKDGMSCSWDIVMTDVIPELSIYVKHLYKNRVGILYEKHIEECALLMWNIIQDFHYEGFDRNWVDIIQDNSEYYGMFITYTKKRLRYGLIDLYREQQGYKRTTRMIDGKRVNVMIGVDEIGLESILFGSVPTGLVISEDKVESYSYFMDWFRQNKNRILTQNQLAFLDRLERIQNEQDLTTQEIYKLVGTEAQKINNRLKTIEQRVLKVWLNENPKGEVSIRQRQLENQLNEMNELLELYEDDTNPEEQNEKIVDWISFNLELEWLDRLINQLCKECRVHLLKVVNDGTGIEVRALHELYELLLIDSGLVKEQLIQLKDKEWNELSGNVKGIDYKGDIVHEYQSIPEEYQNKVIYYHITGDGNYKHNLEETSI